jgi:RND family efflux transporter MFP subunit
LKIPLLLLNSVRMRPAFLLIISAFCFGGCDRPSGTGDKTAPAKKSETPMAVTLVKPTRGPISRPVTLPATVQAFQKAVLYSKVGGYVKAIHADRGDVVKQGTVLAEIEAPELLADLGKWKADFDLAQLDLQRMEDARSKAPDLVVLQSVDTAKARALSAKANLDRAQTMLDFCKIIAPFSGTVTRRHVDPGAFVPAATAGSAAQTAAVFTLMDFSRVRVEVAVPEMETPLIRKGVAARIIAEELAGKAFSGTVTRFAHALDEATKTMITEIELDNPDGQLRPGMFVTARLEVEKKENALLLPGDAVLFEKGVPSVFVVEAGKAKKVPVKAGFNDGTAVEILQGVEPTQEVILLGKTVLTPGQPVQVK